MDMEKSIRSYQDRVDAELKLHMKLIGYDLAAMREICERALRGDYQSLDQVNFVAGVLHERWTRIEEKRVQMRDLNQLEEEVSLERSQG
jgi:hypothetical protein